MATPALDTDDARRDSLGLVSLATETGLVEVTLPIIAAVNRKEAIGRMAGLSWLLCLLTLEFSDLILQSSNHGIFLLEFGLKMKDLGILLQDVLHKLSLHIDRTRLAHGRVPYRLASHDWHPLELWVLGLEAWRLLLVDFFTFEHIFIILL